MGQPFSIGLISPHSDRIGALIASAVKGRKHKVLRSAGGKSKVRHATRFGDSRPP
jgi:hypothetical protein